MIVVGTPCKLVGLSLSLCIKDVLEGKICETQIDHLVSPTRWTTPEHLNDGLDAYARDYWQRNPMLGMQIARRLFSKGLVDQPRCTNNTHPGIAYGRWVLCI